ncbi:MAG TPA: contractile injection system protein, VgrG/Pvc8 family [Chloroflexaceae bacterium]|nr:contractile injection system protein, VgrG/Pvc8 family [Chloroflexaceae bacterium]
MPAFAYRLTLADTPVDSTFYGDVLALTVAEHTAGASTLRMRLLTERDGDGAWRHLADERLALYTKVSVRIGFTAGGGLAALLGALAGGLGGLGAGGSGDDGLEAVFDGYITAVEVSLAGAPGASHLDVSATDTSVLMSLEEKVAAWPNLSDADVVRQILGGYGVEARVDPTAAVRQENETTLVQRGSDLQLVRELARRNGLEFYFETDRATGQVVGHCRAPQLDGPPQPDLAVQFGEQSNLRSFSARVTGQRPLSVKAAQVDVRSGSANTGEAGDMQLPPLGARDAAALIGGPLATLVAPKEAAARLLMLGPPTSDPAELRALTQAARDEAGWFISAKGEVNGDAYQAVLRPRRLVLVKGAGKPFSGKYYVTSVVHELRGDSGYSLSFEARRNARDVDGSEQFGGGGLGLALPGL